MVASTVRTRAPGRDATCLAGVLLLVCGCGSSGASGPSVTGSPSETIVSSPRLESPSPSPGSGLGFLGPNNCTESPAPNSSRTDSHVGATIDVPSAWTVLPDSQATETVALGLESPSDYSFTPTRIGILSLMGSWPTGTDPRVPLSDWYQPAPPNGHPEFNVTLVGTAEKCTLASGPPAYFEYTPARSQSTGSPTLPDSPLGVHGYMVALLHGTRGVGLRIEGGGGIDLLAGAPVKQKPAPAAR